MVQCVFFIGQFSGEIVPSLHYALLVEGCHLKFTKFEKISINGILVINSANVTKSHY